MSLLRSILFTVLMFVSVPIWAVVVIAVRVFGENASYAAIVVWVRGTLWLCRWLCGLDYRVEGIEHLPKRSSVVLLKHSSAYETFVQFLIFPKHVAVLKRELMWAPFLGWALATIRPIAINRSAGSSAVEQIREQGTERLNEGIWVIIFPEGTRMAPGETRRYGVSGVLLAQHAERVLVPVAHNAGDFWPRRGWRKVPGTVTFSIGPPIDASGREPREVNREAQAWIEAKVAELRNPHGD